MWVCSAQYKVKENFLQIVYKVQELNKTNKKKGESDAPC